MDESAHSSTTKEPSSNEEDNDSDSFCDIGSLSFQEVFPISSGAGLLPDGSSEAMTNHIRKVEPLRPEDVRWFYCTKKKKKLKPLIGYDSIRLENEWRLLHYQHSLEQNIKRVHIRGGMYEADVIKLQCYPIYWSSLDLKSDRPEGESIIRGSWFFEVNWQPLDVDIANRLEAEHVERWKGYSVRQIKELMNNKVMHSVQLDGCHVDWNSVTDILFYKDATTHRAFRNIVQKFGVSKATSGGYRLHRGYSKPAVIYDTHSPVSHLVFVIHGIGAKSDRRKIVRNSADFRSVCHRVKPKSFTERVEFIPVEWRSKAKLDGDIVETITPKKSQGVRRFLNNTAMDIMYYASPLYRSEIVNGLRSELNRIYSLFIDKNPKFNGKIHVMAHSLGNVILHDILTNWKPSIDLEEDQAPGTEDGRLIFQVDTLFSAGSPLGVFLCLRGYRPENGIGIQDDIIPRTTCRRIFNIFHPADPVAYRLEPLILPHYSDIPPVQISSYATLVKAQRNEPAPPVRFPLSAPPLPEPEENIDDLEDAAENGLSMDSDSPADSPTLKRQSSYLRSMSFAVAGGAVRLSKGLWSKAHGAKDTSPTPPIEENVDTHVSATSSMNPLLQKCEDIDETPSQNDPQLLERIDYELPEGFTESKLGYAALTSHTSYWTNQDLAMFLMTYLHEEKRVFDL